MSKNKCQSKNPASCRYHGWITAEVHYKAYDEYKQASESHFIARMGNDMREIKFAEKREQEASANYDATPDGMEELKAELQTRIAEGKQFLSPVKYRLEIAEELWAKKTMKHNAEIFETYGELNAEDVSHLFEDSNYHLDGEILKADGKDDVKWSELSKEELLQLRKKDFKESKQTRFYNTVKANTLAELKASGMSVEEKANGSLYYVTNTDGERVGEINFAADNSSVQANVARNPVVNGVTYQPFVTYQGYEDIRREFERYSMNAAAWTIPSEWQGWWDKAVGL